MSRHQNNNQANRYRLAAQRPATQRSATQRSATQRRGLTLIELMMVTTILVMMAGSLAALATVVQSGSNFNQANNEVTQHGRVALERIERAIASATASRGFPGCFVYSERIDGWEYPDTLIVWNPPMSAANPDGLPMIAELVVFCPNPGAPNELLEIRHSEATGPAPPLDDTFGWQTLMADFKFGDRGTRVLLTDLLRVAAPTQGGYAPARGVVRFDVKRRPSAAEWNEFTIGRRAWRDLSWVQDIHGSGTGLRQTWCRIELQLQMEQFSEAGAATTIPFFGSGTVYHELHRS